MESHSRVLPRWLAGLLGGVVVGGIVFLVSSRTAWKDLAGMEMRYQQWGTAGEIEGVGEAIEEYRRENGVLPKSLSEVPKERRDEDGETRSRFRGTDLWQRPLVYWTDGTRYRVTSLGRDGKPGGVGLDYDLTSEELFPDGPHRPFQLRLSPKSYPTWWQFARDARARPMLSMCLIGASFAFALSLWAICVPPRVRPGQVPVVRVAGRLLAITVASALATGILAVLHHPVHH